MERELGGKGKKRLKRGNKGERKERGTMEVRERGE